ncbi:DUF1513 domain-containing protein [Neptunicoccus cionae]|uniref:DUF1513 domain-containing protein n=1 Tax=Neptunicoccus cionae TaxID=2035344 RepID=A0A916VPK4_9RHOB|nr:DUF1513 domain-containing protein [Amylibacter cionae]GGA17130.1 hypothetical protein GCM10011498_17130 [Amylibacter cionae]
MTSRRGFLAGLAAAGLAPRTTWASAGAPALLAAARTDTGAYVLCGLSAAGEVLFDIPLPDRGHAAAAHPHRAEAVAFARRPGRFAVILNCVNGAVLATLDAPNGRHFYGHGSFSQDGRYLFTTENDYEAGQGVIGVWDSAKDYRRVGEFGSGGVGPHEIKTLPSGDLVVANGGIETHPDAGRAKLNIPTMQSNLSYLSTQGSVIETVRLDPALHKNSIRHLDVSDDGLVAAGMQWQGDKGQVVPLIFTHKQGKAAGVLDLAPALYRRMNGYVGSIGIDHTGRQIAATSPRGGLVLTAELRGRVQDTSIDVYPDVCGVAFGPFGRMVTTGAGQVIGGLASTPNIYPKLHWDNHLVRI